MTAVSFTEGAPALRRLTLGTAPDSWGVWFPDDPGQPTWTQYLDEIVEAGYRWTELGPFGYLPTDPARLRDELERRGLRLSGGAAFGALHQPGAFDGVLADCVELATLLTALGAAHLVYLPALFRDTDEAGDFVEPAELDATQWKSLVTGMSQLGRILADECGVSLVFHPHADSHVGTQPQVERFLADTDPAVVSICLDTGHISYYRGDNVDLIRKYPERIGYAHLKAVDEAVRDRVESEGLSFAQAVRLGAMTEPPAGDPDLVPVLAALGELDRDLFAIVEQDLYPCARDVPLPIARRTRQFLNRSGLGPIAADSTYTDSRSIDRKDGS